MKKLLIPLLLAAPLGAQTINVYPGYSGTPGTGNITEPIKTVQSFSAHVTGVNNKTVTWSVSSGASLVPNTPVCADATKYDCTIGVYTTTPGNYTVTATANDASHVTAQGGVTFSATPTPLTTHPRLMFNASNVTAFQTYFAGSAAIPTNFINNAATLAAADDAAWAAGGGYNGGNSSAGCPGGGGGTGIPSTAYNTQNYLWEVTPEENAIVYAEMALVGPSATRAAYACRAHDLYIYNMKDMLGLLPGENTATCDCLGNPHLLLGNRGSVWGVGIAEVYDWDFSSFTSGDKSSYIVPAMLAMIANANTNAGVIATSTPLPLGVVNNPSLIQTGSTDAYGYMRSFANNYGLYYQGFEIALGMALDAADDPNTAHCAGGFDTVCSDGTPNSVRAAFHYGLGAWTYTQYLNFEDPAVSTAALNQAFGSTLTPTDQCTSNFNANPSPITATMPCYGNEHGGLSHEGAPLYGAWQLHLANIGEMLATSGYNDPTGYPQMSLFTASTMDESIQGYEHLALPAVYTPSQSFQPLLVYGPNNAGYDQLNFFANLPITLYATDLYMGRTDRLNALGWLSGNLNIEYSLATNMAGSVPAAVSLTLTMLPGATPFSTFTDPRPTMPPGYFSFNAGNLITSSGSWSATTGGVFRRYCPRFPQPNHEEGYCGDFDFYLNGDWVTAGIQSYAFNDSSQNWTGEAPDTGNMAAYGNTPSLLPNPTNQNEYIVDGLANRGGQFNNSYPTGQSNNDYYNDMPNYTFDEVDSTGLRNAYGPNPGSGSLALTDVTGATTDFLWIKPHVLATYNRGNMSTASFARNWYMSTGAVTVSGTHLSWPSSLNKNSSYLDVLKQPAANIGVYAVYPFAQAIAANYYPAATGSRIEIDSGTINHSTTETYTANNCSLSGAANAVCPTNRVNAIADLGVTGGVSCGSLTQISNASTPASCQYTVTADFRYTFFAADLAAGIHPHYDWSTPASSMRSLNVFQGQNFGTAAVSVTSVSSSAGQTFDCFLYSTNTTGCFMNTLASFTGTTIPVSAAGTLYVSNLSPNTAYNASGAGVGASVTSDTAGVAILAPTGSGSVVLTPGSGPPAPPINFSGHAQVSGHATLP